MARAPSCKYLVQLIFFESFTQLLDVFWPGEKSRLRKIKQGLRVAFNRAQLLSWHCVRIRCDPLEVLEIIFVYFDRPLSLERLDYRTFNAVILWCLDKLWLCLQSSLNEILIRLFLMDFEVFECWHVKCISLFQNRAFTCRLLKFGLNVGLEISFWRHSVRLSFLLVSHQEWLKALTWHEAQLGDWWVD